MKTQTRKNHPATTRPARRDASPTPTPMPATAPQPGRARETDFLTLCFYPGMKAPEPMAAYAAYPTAV